MALLFASGTMVCTGAKSEHHSKLAVWKYARIIQKLGFEAKFKDFKIQHIVGSCDVKFPIRLEGLAYAHGNNSINNIFMPRNIRRGMWNFFRLENEHLNNVERYRAFKSVPLPFTYYNDEEEDDDDIDKAE